MFILYNGGIKGNTRLALADILKRINPMDF